MAEKYGYTPDMVMRLSDEQLYDLVPDLHEQIVKQAAQVQVLEAQLRQKEKWDKDHPGQPMPVIMG